MSPSQEKEIKTILTRHARGLGIPEGAAESFIKESIIKTKQTLKTKQKVTDKTINNVLIKELKNYSPDLAYIYENYDKII